MRAIRRRSRLRQLDLARRAGVSQSAISDIELGRLDRMSLRTVRASATALGVDLRLDPRWRGGEIDRLLDEGHARVAALAIALLERHGWECAVEVTYSHFGERGSIDILASDAGRTSVVVVEAKTRLTSIEATLRKLDEKSRLAPSIVQERTGARPKVVARLLALPEGGSARRSVARHDAVLRRAFPLRGAAARSWLAEPGPATGMLILLSGSRPRAPRRAGSASASVVPRAVPATYGREE